MRGRDKRRKDKEEWEVRDKAYGASRLVVQHHRSHIKFHPSDDLWTFFNTTHPNSAIDSLWLTHSLESVPHSSLSQVIRSSHLSIFYPNFPMMSHCVLFYYSFSFWFIIWFVMLFWKGTFWNFPLNNWWAITYWSLKCCLVVLHSSHVYKEAVLPQRKTIKFRFQSKLSFFSKILNSTILITASGFVINSHQGLNHFDYIIGVCPYYVAV